MSLNTINDAPKAWGLPPIETTSPLVEQGYGNTCAIRCQQIILRDFGIDVSEEDLMQMANDNGWFSEDGTSMEHVGKILEAYGVGVNNLSNANVFSLTSELSQGHRVMVAVDSGELWDDGFPEGLEDLFGGAPDHALIVAGIDTSDPDNIRVQLMDPGTGDIARSYPLEQFMDAWEDSGFYMVSTAEPTPPWAYGMDNFGYADFLHLPDVAGVPYAEFERFHALAEQHNDEPDFLEKLTNGFSNLMQGKSFLPEFLSGLFQDNVPSPDELALPDDMQNELRMLAGADEAADYFDRATDADSWADHYQSMSEMHAEWGDHDNAAWYADQAASATDEVNWYHDQGMDALDD